MKRFLLTALMMLAMVIGVYAVPAMPGQWKWVKLSNGSQVRVELVGDEFGRFWRSADGRRFAQNKATDTYYQIPDNQLQKLMSRSATLRQSRDNANMQKRRNSSPAQRKKAYTGSKKGIIILVNFTDSKFADGNDAALFNKIANEVNYTEGDFKGSLRDYFRDQSRGQFDLQFDVVGPVQLAHEVAYYGGNNDNDEDKNASAMIVEACKAVVDQVNFADYDWDGDGEVDQVFVLYAGKGEAAGGSADTIWPHEWNLYSAGYVNTGTPIELMLDGVYIDTYACGAELNAYGELGGIGTICHEFTHCLGLPDFYDTGYSGFDNMGSWDLMASGSYNGNSFCPAGYTAYERYYCEWLDIEELSTESKDINNLKPLTDGGGAYAIANAANEDEFYILENRQKEGWDRYLPGAGLLIIHVDYDPNVWAWNVVNANGSYRDGSGTKTNDHSRCFPVAANGNLNAGIGVPFPFNTINAFGNSTTPQATLFNLNSDGSKLLNKAVENITQNDDGTISFHFNASDENKGQTFDGVLFYESFDQCAGTGGNDGLWSGSIASSALTPDNTGWDFGNSYGGGNKCAKFGNSKIYTGKATTPQFAAGEEVTLTLMAAPWASETTSLRISMNGPGTIETPAWPLTPEKWTPITTKITGANGLTSITFTATNNRFFIDEVKVEAPSTSGIRNIRTVKLGDQRIYTLDGRYAGTDASQLKHGIYVVNGKKIVK